MPRYNYVLDASGNPKPESDILAWARWFEGAIATLQKRAALMKLAGTVYGEGKS